MIIKTKLYCAPPKSGYVTRQALLDRLERVTEMKLTLVSAPAGFGKSHLLASWNARRNRRGCWLSLDRNDKNTDTFLTYLVAAIREMDSALADEAWNLVQAHAETNYENVVAALVNELTYYPGDVVLILDDYHLAESVTINKIVNTLLDRLPRNVHLVLITRSDPALSLAKLRAHGELLEIRSADLRFTDTEACDLFRLNNDVDINKHNAGVVNQKTEGWVVGLHLSSLALSNNKNVNEIITRFSGSHTYVLDYLTEEVLTRLPDGIRDFLLETSILKEFSAELCNYVFEIENSAEQLAYLELNNIFLISLDNERHWYRYHHLFADVLSIHAGISDKRQQELNWRIATWYAQVGRLADAVLYGFASGRELKTIQMLESYWPSQRAEGHDSQLIEWLSNTELEVIQQSPVLAGYYGLALLSHDPEKGMYLLDTTRNYFEQTSPPFTIQESTSFGIVNIGEAYIHAAQGNTQEVLSRVRQALQVFPIEEQVWRGSSRALEGIALWREGKINEAEICLNAAVANMDRSKDKSAQITSRFLLGDFYYQFGWLTKAKSVVEFAIGINEQNTGYTIEGCADVYLLLAEVEFEQGNTDIAVSLLDAAEQFGSLGSMPEAKYRYPLIEARIALADKRENDAKRLFYEAESLYLETPNPCHRPPSYWIGVYQLNNGNLESVNIPAPFDKNVQSNSFSYLLYLLAEPTSQEKVEQALFSIEVSEFSPNIRLVQKIALTIGASASGDTTLAKKTLEQLVSIQNENRNSVWPHEIKAINRLFEIYGLKTIDSLLSQAAPALLEPLSAKEKEVLKWLDTELTGPQITSKLFVSLNTLRTHTKNIYSKLGVTNRRAAINKARSYNILS
ncbi:LuxR C-terminal-related transcriptional regulator [Vibrio algarum]|uniref:LuxR C-terminal-related transcriptional regulator n=1 Tax=Vibrio algarum TaxID=3020714 RepID=A0ABT4YS55_9VIBR|nr:LuxR C-terminal-related transcriptional regulator [Vibrio sp. KJ40-1]MDB1124232.1 LuxR C-terminal-related transcriptional regulator [Vibrio sp. KJ40-1]